MSDRYSVELDKMFLCDPVDYVAVISGIGHGGDTASLYVASNLNQMVKEEIQKGRTFLKAVEEASLELDARLLQAAAKIDAGGCQGGCIFNDSGATLCSFWIQGSKIYCANIGNCRVIASVAGNAQAITKDHVPDDPVERGRIENAGGRVTCNKIDYKLNTARAFGLFSYKPRALQKSLQQVIIALPNVYEVSLDTKIDFFVLASNSVWEVLTNQQVVTFVQNHLREMSLEETAKGLIEWCESLCCGGCQHVHNCAGNLTCIILTLSSPVFCGIHHHPSCTPHHLCYPHSPHPPSHCSSRLTNSTVCHTHKPCPGNMSVVSRKL